MYPNVVATLWLLNINPPQCCDNIVTAMAMVRRECPVSIESAALDQRLAERPLESSPLYVGSLGEMPVNLRGTDILLRFADRACYLQFARPVSTSCQASSCNRQPAPDCSVQVIM